MLAVSITVSIGHSTGTLILVVGVLFTPLVGRTVRAAVLAEREFDYVPAARLRGERAPYIMFVEILPNIMAPIIVEATVRLGYAIFTIAGLTFLGFGVQPPSPDWALQISDNYTLIAAGTYWWTVLFPAPRDRVAGDRDQPRRRRPLAGARAMSTPTPVPALEIEDLDVVYRVRGIDREVLRGVTFTVRAGESYGLVGESGCGKSTTALTVVRYLPRNGRVRGGAIRVAGTDMLALSREQLRETRAKRLSMVYQNPADALNPSLQVGFQVAEVFRVGGAAKGDALPRAREALSRVQIADPDSVLERYPHQLSGGMQQRVVIAMALAKDPGAADPRRADDGPRRHRRGRGARPDRAAQGGLRHLGPLHQPQPRDDPQDVRPRRRALRRPAGRGGPRRGDPPGSAPPLHRRAAPLRPARRRAQGPRPPRHDPGLPADDRRAAPRLRLRLALRARAGDLLDDGAAAARASPPATRAAATFTSARAELPRATAADLGVALAVDRSVAPMLRLDDVAKIFRQRGHEVRALADVDRSTSGPGETLGLVGESGSGKTTLARTLLGLHRADAAASSSSTARALAGAARQALASRTCARCRSSSRTPTRRSTAATACGAS